jgi:microcompartment protein CcmK/EutM
MEKYLRINSLAVAKAADTSVAPNTNNELKGSGAIDFTAVAEAGDFVLISTGGSNGPAYALDKVVSVTDADELILNTTSTFGIPTGKQFQIYDKDTRRDNIIRCNDIVSIVQIGGARDVAAGSPIVGLIYTGIEIQYTGGAMLTIVFEGNDPNETKAGLFLDALINQIETHLQSSATKVMADFVIPPGSEDFVAIQRGSAAVAVS